MDKEGQTNHVTQTATNQTVANWQYKPEGGQAMGMSNGPNVQTPTPRHVVEAPIVTWTASEFISHDKSTGWYALLGVGTAALAAVVYLLTHDTVSTGVVVVVAIVFGILAARKPRELEYSVDDKGVKVGDKFYPFSGFRSFSIVQEDAVESIWFMPLKRFMPPLTIYFDPRDGQKIVDVLSQTLPMENRQLDAVDRLMHRLRF